MFVVKDMETGLFKMHKEKKGISAVVGTVILVALTIAIVAIVWLVISNLVESGIGSQESCFGAFDKVNLDPRYTCYDSSSEELQFSIKIGDIETEGALISISGQGSSTSFILNTTESSISNVVSYPSRSANVRLPGKNSGLTYIYNLSAGGFTGEPDRIEIAPIIGGNQCSVSDSIQKFESCSLIAG